MKEIYVPFGDTTWLKNFQAGQQESTPLWLVATPPAASTYGLSPDQAV